MSIPDLLNSPAELNTINSGLATSLAEFALNNPNVIYWLKTLGHTQVEPPHTGFYLETFPGRGEPEEVISAWSKRQDLRKLEYLSNLSPEKIAETQRLQDTYDRTLRFTQEQTNSSIQILRNSKFGLRQIFLDMLDKKSSNTETMLDIMRQHGIQVNLFPDREKGFGNKDNHGQVRYREGGWITNFNANALRDPSEILHEFIAIESFNPYISDFPTLKTRLLHPISCLFNGYSVHDFNARSRYSEYTPLAIPILESTYELLNMYRGEGNYPYHENFRTILK
jgi:hypothetical protein